MAAASGAIQLEHQFTGEKLIVPQAGEFFLNAGRLMPVAGTPGSCQCTETDQQVVPAPTGPPLEYATNTAPPAEPASAPAVVEAAAAPNTVPTVEFSIPAHANEGHPIVPQANDVAPAAPPASVPIYTVVLPPLVFMANSPGPPPIPTADMAVLIREAQVSPEWEFSGRVEAPEFAQEMQRALGRARPADAGGGDGASADGATEEKEGRILGVAEEGVWRVRAMAKKNSSTCCDKAAHRNAPSARGAFF